MFIPCKECKGQHRLYWCSSCILGWLENNQKTIQCSNCQKIEAGNELQHIKIIKDWNAERTVFVKQIRVKSEEIVNLEEENGNLRTEMLEMEDEIERQKERAHKLRMEMVEMEDEIDDLNQELERIFDVLDELPIDINEVL